MSNQLIIFNYIYSSRTSHPNEKHHQITNQPTNQPNKQTTNQPTNQPNNQPGNEKQLLGGKIALYGKKNKTFWQNIVS